MGLNLLCQGEVSLIITLNIHFLWKIKYCWWRVHMCRLRSIDLLFISMFSHGWPVYGAYLFWSWDRGFEAGRCRNTILLVFFFFFSQAHFQCFNFCTWCALLKKVPRRWSHHNKSCRQYNTVACRIKTITAGNFEDHDGLLLLTTASNSCPDVWIPWFAGRLYHLAIID